MFGIETCVLHVCELANCFVPFSTTVCVCVYVYFCYLLSIPLCAHAHAAVLFNKINVSKCKIDVKWHPIQFSGPANTTATAKRFTTTTRQRSTVDEEKDKTNNTNETE